MDGPPDNDFCSVCHGIFNIPCQANCSHWFCGHCIMMVWEHSSTFRPCRCPLCRRPITLLIPTDDSVRERHNPAVGDILQRVETYNRLFGGPNNSLFQRMQDLPFLLQRLLRELMNPQRSLPLAMRARVYISDLAFAGQIAIPSGENEVLAPFFIDLARQTELILSVVYIISPVDIIPEAVLGVVGLLDDLLIVLICFLHVGTLYRSVLYYRHRGS